MENKYFSLEIRDDNRLTKILWIIFGLMCCGIALFWMIYNLRSGKVIEKTMDYNYFFVRLWRFFKYIPDSDWRQNLLNLIPLISD